MVRSCAAKSCTNRDCLKSQAKGIRFYRIPVTEEKRRLWLTAMERMDFTPTPDSAVCSVHFAGGEKSKHSGSPAYVPSLFNFTPASKRKQIQRSLRRWNYAKKREELIKLKEKEDESAQKESNNVEIDPVVDDNDDAMKSVGVQTEFTMKDLCNLEMDYQRRQEEMTLLHKHISGGFPTENQLKSDGKLLKFYTGISTFTVLMAVYKFVSTNVRVTKNNKLTPFNSFIMTLMKLRLHLSNYDLGIRYGICDTTVGRTFKKWIFVMNEKMGPLIQWPTRESLQRTMPFCFRVNYGLKVVAIIDCFEIFVEKPSELLAKACTWSQYKHYNTAKYLIGITPQGVVSFVSNGWGGRVSDKFITENSRFLDNLLPGDVVLADRGFNIEECVGSTGASLEIPAFTRGRDQLSVVEVENTRKIANVRIHVERVIGAVRQRYTILSATGILQKEVYQQKNDGVLLLDAIVRVCCALTNMCGGIVPFV